MVYISFVFEDESSGKKFFEHEQSLDLQSVNRENNDFQSFYQIAKENIQLLFPQLLDLVFTER